MGGGAEDGSSCFPITSGRITETERGGHRLLLPLKHLLGVKALCVFWHKMLASTHADTYTHSTTGGLWMFVH